MGEIMIDKQILIYWLNTQITKFIKRNLYYASSSQGFSICFGQVGIETTIIEIDFDREGYRVPP